MYTDPLSPEMERRLLAVRALLEEIEDVELREEIYLAVADLLRAIVEGDTRHLIFI